MLKETASVSVKNAVLLLATLFLWCFYSSCNNNPVGHTQHQYSIYILGKDGKEYLAETDVLDSGVMIPEKQGALLDGQDLDRDIIVKSGNYYHLNRKKALFSKYEIQNGAIKTVAAVPLQNFTIENYYWIGKDSLLLAGLDARKYQQAKYVLLQTARMEVLAAADINIPKPSGKFNSMSIGFVERRGGKLFMGYTYHQYLSPSDYTTSDTTYIAVLSYPDIKVSKTEKNTRSTYPGGTNMVQSYTFNDEKHNYYFMSCPGIALGNRRDLPTGVFRIKAAEETLDKDYFLNISGSAVKNHGYGIWYLGNNKAIVRTERKDLFKGLSDHYSTAHFEFWLLDLATQKVLNKLDLPLDKGTRRECVIVKGDIAYIALNSTAKGNFIWLYHIKTGKLKKGLELAGNTDFIMRIDRLNP